MRTVIENENPQLMAAMEAINSKELIMYDYPLPEMPEHTQVLRVTDIIIALSEPLVKMCVKRILTHKVTGVKTESNLHVPKWDRDGSHRMPIRINVGTEEEPNFVKPTYDVVVYDDVVVDGSDPENVITEEQEQSRTPTEYLVFTLKGLLVEAEEKPLMQIVRERVQEYVEEEMIKDPEAFTKI